MPDETMPPETQAAFGDVSRAKAYPETTLPAGDVTGWVIIDLPPGYTAHIYEQGNLQLRVFEATAALLFGDLGGAIKYINANADPS